MQNIRDGKSKRPRFPYRKEETEGFIIGSDWVCPKCQHSNAGGLMVCEKCGFDRRCGMTETELRAIIACGQSDGYLVKWAKEQLEKKEIDGD